MTFLVERLAELRRHLDHLRAIRPRVPGPAALDRDLSLHNDVLFSLLTVCQLVIDIAGELSARRGERFESAANKSIPPASGRSSDNRSASGRYRNCFLETRP